MITKGITLKVEGISIIGQLFIPDSGPCHPVVCICHGIPSGNAPAPDDRGYPLVAEKLCNHQLAAVFFNFRGTGLSGGNIDLMGWTRDLKGVIDFLVTLPWVDPCRIALFGFSGGAAAAVHVAAGNSRVSCVAACACPADFTLLTGHTDPAVHVAYFRRIGAIRDKDFPRSTRNWIDGFKKVRPIQNIHRISPRPLLLIHGNDDETVPASHAHRLYEKAGEPKQLEVLNGAGHKLRQDDRVIPTFIRWFKSHFTQELSTRN